MGTSSNRSSGTQITPKGINQGTVLVDPVTGLPINTTDGNLDVNATVVATIGDVVINSHTSTVAVQDPSNDNILHINSDGSIDVNTVISSLNDSIRIVGTEDGTSTGIQHVLKVGSDLKLQIRDNDANTTLTTIDSDLNSFKSTNHLDLIQIDTDLVSFKNTNHSDLVQIDTDLGILHSDLGIIEGKQDTSNANLSEIALDTDHLDANLSTLATIVNQTSELIKLDTVNTNLTTIQAKQDVGNISLASIDGKIIDNYGSSTNALRVASQIGNTTGPADFNTGSTDAQTLRVTSNITRNGNELDYGYGTVGVNTIRTAAEIGNGTNIADFNSGPTGTQTLRTNANQGVPNSIGNSWPIKVTDGVNTQAIKGATTTATATDPAAVIALTPNRPITYSAAIFNATLPVSFLGLVGYFFSLQGSATKTVRITKISLSGTETTTGQHVFTAYLATSIAGGTATTVNSTPHDFSNPAATAVPIAWESGATPGGIGTLLIRSWTLFMPAATGNVAGTQINEKFGYGPSQEIILRGTAQFFTFAIQGVAPSGALMNAYIEWTEE